MTVIKPGGIKGAPEERRALREQRREHNRVQFIRDEAASARNGREQLVVACRFAQAVGRRLTDKSRTDLARAISEVVERANVSDNHRKAGERS